MKLYSQDMSDFGTFATCLGGVNATVAWKKHADHSVKADFSYLGTSYEFGISRWKGKAFTNFQLAFHDKYTDVTTYGSSNIDDEGLPSINTTSDQKLNIVTRATKDVFKYLDVLVREHQKSILDYSCWYRERHAGGLSTYEEYIQLATTHCIVHAEFLAGNVPWSITPFVV